jgi:flagellar hook protein FlgE
MGGTLQGIFNTSVQGLNAQAQAMNVVSTNITNVQTTGYKVQDNNFQTLLNHVSASNGNAQSFFAVRDVNTTDVNRQGQIITTNRTMDLALNGKGLIVTNTAQDGVGQFQYTRDGSFFGKAIPLSTSTNGVPDQGTLLTTSNGNFVYGWAANADGTFTETNDLASLVPVQYASNATFDAQPTTAINVQANLAQGSDGRQSVGLPFIDLSGTSQTVTLGFTRDMSNNYTLDGVTSSGSTVSMTPSQVSFDSLGNISDPSDGKVQITVNDPLGPQDITVDLSRMTSLAGDSGITVQQIDQDGFIAGTLSNTYFTSDGVLMGSYSNHEVKPLFKLAIANFANNDGLQALPGNMYVQTQPGWAQDNASGDLTLSGLGTSATGSQFVVGALEGSTVSLEDQFSKMIITQRCYSSAAKVVQVADEMTQAVRDLKR